MFGRFLKIALRCAAVLFFVSVGISYAAEPEVFAKQVLEATHVRGGFVSLLGCGDGRLAKALKANASYQVQALDRDGAKVAATREFLIKEGVYGDVCADTFSGANLPYIDNLVNLFVAEDLGGVAMSEVMRVLVPNGSAYIKQDGAWKTIVKTRPAALDEWTHFYYDARGNAVSKDTTVGPPTQLQWLGSPRWSRHHDRISSLSAMVSAGGRNFYIMDEGSRISILLPSKWTLIARDSFNGTVLWKKSIDKWQTQMWPLKSGPTQLARRLVAVGDRVYVTLGIEDPVSCLDAATGEVIKVFNQTKGTEEMIVSNGTLYALVNPGKWTLEDFAPKMNTGDQQVVAKEYNWDKKARELVAINTESGAQMWRNKDIKVAPLTLTSDGKRLVYYDGDKLVGLDPKSGTTRWSSPPEEDRKLFEFNFGPRVILHDNVVLYAGGTGTMKALNADSGKEMWGAPHSKSGYRSPEDLIVAGGLIWNAPTTAGSMSGAFSGRSLLTGEVKSEFAPDVKTYWFHHRCYIAKATEKYILPSRTGIEFVDFAAKHWEINHWVRGACLYGIMPCNGLVYAGPHDCACYPETKLFGMNALAPTSPTPLPAALPDEQRLEKGPAFGEALNEADADAKDWPMYRHDPARSGFTNQPLAEDLGKAWETNIGGKLSAPVVAGGLFMVSQVDQHTIHALDANTGAPKWKFTAGARVDSPPTYWKGRVVFGGMDGCVYCLRATDGKLIWKYHVAPVDRRHMAFEQLESVWPIPGAVLVENGVLACVAGRSVFLDGGLRFMRLDVATGKKVAEKVYDEKDPETGLNLQTRVKTLQMPVGLNDVLSSDGKFTYLHSQKIAGDGTRVEIGPVSGNSRQQGSAQKGEGSHIFAPVGFLDDTWFHRAYWVYGKSFAGGHDGYFQAGKFTPTGRILVFDDKDVYAYGRQPQYFKWTTTMEYQLSSASKEAPDVKPEMIEGPGQKGGKKAGAKAAAKADHASGPHVSFPDADKLDPTKTPLTVEAWIYAGVGTGVIVSHGGGQNGYALTLQDGKPAFSVRSKNDLAAAVSTKALDEGWHHLAGELGDKKVKLFVDGALQAEVASDGLIAKKPNQGLALGAASGNSLVSDHGKGEGFVGLIDQFLIYHKVLNAAEIADHAAMKIDPVKHAVTGGAVVAFAFDNGDARDQSGNKIHGAVVGAEVGKGKLGGALLFKNTPEPHPADVAAEKEAKPATPAPAADPAVAQKEKDPTEPDAADIKHANDPKDKNEKVAGGKRALGAVRSGDSFVKNNWARPAPIFARAMAMSGDTLLYAGPPDSVDEEYAFERLKNRDPAILNDLAEQDAALSDKKGAKILAVSKSGDGLNKDIDLDSTPVWDGMVVAQGRIYVAGVNGKVICFGKRAK